MEKALAGFACALAVVAALPALAIASSPQKTPSLFAEELLAAAAAAASSTLNNTAQSGEGLSEPDANQALIALTRPAIVRIIAHYSGTTTVPDFEANLKELTWSMDADGPTEKLPFDQYVTASGFIITPNGYILTNAHVVTGKSLLTEIALNLESQAVLDDTFEMPEWEQNEIAQKYSKQQLQEFAARGVTYIMNHLSISTPKISVLTAGAQTVATTTSAFTIQVEDQTSDLSDQNLDQLMKTGVSADIASANENFMNDQKDVALIKVSESDLPTLTLSTSPLPAVGSPIYIFGYPANADVSGLTNDPSFTPGVVSALKESAQGTFSYIETDAKISDGSSGSPMFNAAGEAVGIATLSSDSSNGDTFSFGIPISVAEALIAKTGVVVPQSGDYANDVRSGLAQMQALHCKAALAYFNAAANMNTVFSNPKTYVNPLIERCNAIISSGQSVDGALSALEHWAKTRGAPFWPAVALSVIFAALVIVGAIKLSRHLNRDDEILEELEHEVNPGLSLGLSHAAPSAAAKPAAGMSLLSRMKQESAAPAPPDRYPQLTEYITQARQSGQQDAAIRTVLLTQQWKDADISAAFSRLGD